jgi:1-acyl-sn-glycerol-3-phosphate acyltransferase
MIRRRLVTIPRTILLWLLLTVSLPVTVIAAVSVDLVRHLTTGKPAMATRLLFIAWVYFGAEVAVIVVAGLQWLLSLLFGRRAEEKRCDWSYSLQSWWVATVMTAMRRAFRLTFETRGDSAVAPGPIIVLFRHVSIMDNLLPHAFVSAPNGIRLRWVLKRELLNDPALDIGGNRMPNYFVDRNSTDAAAERANIAALGEDMGPHDGVLLFPEGTRFSRSRREQRMARLAETSPELHDIIAGHDNVLPPRSGGVLALLDHGADVVVAAHAGFEDLRGIKEIWQRTPVDRTITLSFRRFTAGEIPPDAAGRKRWLHEAWAWVGDEVTALLAES